MEKKYKLYTWDWSCFGCGTAFFYFKVNGRKHLIMVEWCDDEHSVSDVAQKCTKDGDMLEEFVNLTDKEKKYFVDVCSKIVAEKK